MSSPTKSAEKHHNASPGLNGPCPTETAKTRGKSKKQSPKDKRVGPKKIKKEFKRLIADKWRVCRPRHDPLRQTVDASKTISHFDSFSSSYYPSHHFIFSLSLSRLAFFFSYRLRRVFPDFIGFFFLSFHISQPILWYVFFLCTRLPAKPVITLKKKVEDKKRNNLVKYLEMERCWCRKKNIELLKDDDDEEAGLSLRFFMFYSSESLF